MAKFYVGQPVVCVWSAEQWAEHTAQTPIPKQGARYVVSRVGTGYSYRGVVLVINGYQYGNPYDAVALVGFDQGIAWREAGFAPITENQVQAIIAMATDVPDEVARELEDS